MKCILCEKEFEGFGNNPHPLVLPGKIFLEMQEGRCCDSCNIRVIAARLDELHRKVYGSQDG